MHMNIHNIFQDSDAKDYISEETQKAIQEAFDKRVEDAVNSRVDAEVKKKIDLAVESALVQQDEQFAVKLEQLVEAIDTDQTTKLHKVVEALEKRKELMESDYTKKLLKVKKLYENRMKRLASSIKNDASELKNEMVSKMANYLDIYLDNSIPKKDMQLALENTRAKQTLQTIREMVGIDSSVINSDIKDAMKDAKLQLESKQSDIVSLQEENKKLRAVASKIKSELILESKTKDLPSNKKQYMKRVLSNKPSSYIKENFDYVLSMFENNEEQQNEVLKEEALKKSVKAKYKIDESKSLSNPDSSDFVNEDILNDIHSNDVSEYIKVLESL